MKYSSNSMNSKNDSVYVKYKSKLNRIFHLIYFIININININI